MSSQTSKKAKAAAQQYKNAAQNNSKAAHDALATATAKGVEDAHVKVTSGSSAYASGKHAKSINGRKALPAKLPDKFLALAFEIVGAIAGTLAGSIYALKETFYAAHAQLRKGLGFAKSKAA